MKRNLAGTWADESYLDIRDGVIHYKLYAQDGTTIPMTCADTVSNRRFVSWVQIHDRYTVAGDAHHTEAA